jgi:hypothetical protein
LGQTASKGVKPKSDWIKTVQFNSTVQFLTFDGTYTDSDINSLRVVTFNPGCTIDAGAVAEIQLQK